MLHTRRRFWEVVSWKVSCSMSLSVVNHCISRAVRVRSPRPRWWKTYFLQSHRKRKNHIKIPTTRLIYIIVTQFIREGLWWNLTWTLITRCRLKTRAAGDTSPSEISLDVRSSNSATILSDTVSRGLHSLVLHNQFVFRSTRSYRYDDNNRYEMTSGSARLCCKNREFVEVNIRNQNTTTHVCLYVNVLRNSKTVLKSNKMYNL